MNTNEILHNITYLANFVAFQELLLCNSIILRFSPSNCFLSFFLFFRKVSISFFVVVLLLLHHHHHIQMFLLHLLLFWNVISFYEFFPAFLSFLFFFFPFSLFS